MIEPYCPKCHEKTDCEKIHLPHVMELDYDYVTTMSTIFRCRICKTRFTYSDSRIIGNLNDTERISK